MAPNRKPAQPSSFHVSRAHHAFTPVFIGDAPVFREPFFPLPSDFPEYATRVGLHVLLLPLYLSLSDGLLHHLLLLLDNLYT